MMSNGRTRSWRTQVGRGLATGIVLAGTVLGGRVSAWAADPSITISLGGGGTEGSVVLQILALMTVLSLAPAILMMVTAFPRIVIVLSFLRQAMGTQNAPPNQVLIGLAMFLTFLVMQPTWQEIYTTAVLPARANAITLPEALERAEGPMRGFMLRQVREKDLAFTVTHLTKLPPEETLKGHVPTYVVIVAFLLSELKTAFTMGFMIYVPFLIIDLVVSSLLMSLNMMMLSPMMISLPFKLILFVLTDGWNLVVGALVQGFH